MNEFKQVHQQSNKQEGITVLHSFYSKWQKAYKHVIQNVKDLEADLLVFITIRNRSEVQSIQLT